MSQAIHTKYLGATNSRGARYQAKAEGGESVTVPANYALDSSENHAAAAEALLKKLKWRGKWFFGSTKDGYVFVKDDGIFLAI